LITFNSNEKAPKRLDGSKVNKMEQPKARISFSDRTERRMELLLDKLLNMITIKDTNANGFIKHRGFLQPLWRKK